MSEKEKKDKAKESTNNKEIIITVFKLVFFMLIGIGIVVGITLILGLILSVFKWKPFLRREKKKVGSLSISENKKDSLYLSNSHGMKCRRELPRPWEPSLAERSQ